MKCIQRLLYAFVAIITFSCDEPEMLADWEETKAINGQTWGKLTPISFTVNGIDSMQSPRITKMRAAVLNRRITDYIAGTSYPWLVFTYDLPSGTYYNQPEPYQTISVEYKGINGGMYFGNYGLPYKDITPLYHCSYFKIIEHSDTILYITSQVTGKSIFLKFRRERA